MSKQELLIILGGAVILTIGLIFFTLPKNSNPPIEIQTPTSSSPSAQLRIEDLVVGSGTEAKSESTVTVNYLGTLEDGTKFDSSYDRNEPFTTQIGVGAVIKGWDQGIPGMKVGGKRRLTIPSELGYGPTGAGDIPPNANLIFEIELLDVK